MVVTETLKKYYPFKSNFFESAGGKYHYLDEGTGTPTVMVHGNPSWSFYYRNLVNKLKDNYRCLVPDHIGCGLSDKPTSKEYDYHFEKRAEDLSTWINSLELTGKINLVVHDWGGPIGLMWATQNPEKINKIVILNTAGFLLPGNKKLPSSLKLVRDTWLGKFLVRGFNAFSVGASIVGCKRNPMSKELRSCYQAPYNSWENRVATYEFVHDIPMFPGDRGYEIALALEKDLVKLVDKKIMMCWGMKDFVFDHYFLDRFMEIFPKATVKKYHDCGHYVLEDAAPEILTEIEDFFNDDSIH